MTFTSTAPNTKQCIKGKLNMLNCNSTSYRSISGYVINELKPTNENDQPLLPTVSYYSSLKEQSINYQSRRVTKMYILQVCNLKACPSLQSPDLDVIFKREQKISYITLNK